MNKRRALGAAACLLFALLSPLGKAETMGSFTVSGGTPGTGYTYFSNTLVFTMPGDYTVSGTGNGQETIVVDTSLSTADNPVHITLDSVDIQLDSSVIGPAFKLQTGVHVRLTLVGNNRLSSTEDFAGLGVPGGASLVIDGSGSLLAEGGAQGAGIGGSSGQDGGDISILGGTITAISYGYAAGIGGGFGGNGGTVIISGGDVTARSSFSGAGIGGGSQNPGGSGGSGGNITISGGCVIASGDTYGAGIGGGLNGNGGNISIAGGRVTASSNYDGAGIGGGANGDGGTISILSGVIDAWGGLEGGAGVGGGNHGSSGGTITISGGELNAVSMGYGAGVGGGSGGNGGTIHIFGTADVAARGDGSGSGYGHGAGIGGGNQADGGTITISGGKVIATGGEDAAGIGGGDGGGGGTVNISGGTLRAAGTGGGAGIGGGSEGDGAAVTITGGSICAIPGAALPPEYGIGGGVGGSAGTVLDGSGRDLYYTSVALEGVSAATGVTSLTVDSGAYGINDVHTDEYGYLHLFLPNGAHTTEARTAGKRYTGDIATRTDPSNSYGMLMWYRQIDADGTYNIGDYYTGGQTLHIGGGLNVTLTGGGMSLENFQIECGAGVRLALENVYIDNSEYGYNDSGYYVRLYDNVCPLSFTGSGNTLLLNGMNTMKAGQHVPSVRVAQGTALVINGTGSLTASSCYNGAGIGGGRGENGGNITINGGTLNVTGGHLGAGIGGGAKNGSLGGDGGTVTITGGNVTAEGGGDSAGIGGGYNGSNGTVIISGGTVTATGGFRGAGIGGGFAVNYGGSGGSIAISGGNVNANGGGYAAGIGGGCQGSGGTVTISGGVVFAAGKDGGKDIGAGYSGSGGTLEIADMAAVFLRNDNCVAPNTVTHTHRNYTDHDGGSIFGIPVAWTGDLGTYLHLCTLSFDINGGVGTVPGAKTVLYGQTAALPDGSGLSREDCIFEGWNTQSDGKGTTFDAGESYTVTSSILLYAKWRLPLTGTALISGNAIFGQTLAASLAGGDDAGTLFYQWIRNGADIAGANSVTYTLTEDDIGTLIAVKITGSAQTGTALSAPTPYVEKAGCTVEPVLKPVLLIVDTASVTVAPVTGYEYILVLDGTDMDAGTWQEGSAFTGLAANTAYDAYQRVKETATHKASALSEKLDVSTADSMTYGQLHWQSGTAAITAEGLFAPNAQLVVEPITEGGAVWEELKAQLTDEIAFAAYEISIEPSNAFRPPLELAFQVDPKYNGYPVYILHRQTGGVVEKFTSIAANGLVKITVTELSPFLLAVDPGPKIVAQPQNVIIVTGQTASFEVEAEGVAPLSYQWQRQAGLSAAWEDIKGSVGAKHTTAQANMSNSGYRYRVIVTDGRGYSVTSESAALTVTKVPEPPDTGDKAHPVAYALLALLMTIAGCLLLHRRRAA